MAATKSAGQQASTAGLSAHVALPSGAAGQAGLVPDGAVRGVVQNSGINTSIGAGQYVGAIDLQSASTTFTMPSFGCASSNDYEWLLPGLWVFDSAGNLVDQVDVNFNCEAGGSKYQTDVICMEGGGCDQSISPNPGDVIEATYIQDGAANLSVGIINDRTQGTVAVEEGTATSGSTILQGDMSPAPFGYGTAVPLFTKVPFSISTLNGQYTSDWNPLQLNLMNGSDVQIKSSTVKTTSFSTSFAHNN